MRKLTLLLAALTGPLIVGCGAPTAPTGKSSPTTPAHQHPTKGPHGGLLVEWGAEEYDLEVTADKTTGEVTVYVFGEYEEAHEWKAKAIDAKILTLVLKSAEPPATVTLEAKPAKDDPAGKASVFAGKHDAFKADKKLAGTVSGKVGDKPYTGDFKQK
ncbi:MAG: hypothetical protein ABGY75_15120 [Gemmataceae bacterium]